MAKKDFDTSENIDRNKSTEQDWESHHTTSDRYPDDAKGIAETDVKNAHAAGDGALERSEKDLTEKNESNLFSNDDNDQNQRGKVDPPY